MKKVPASETTRNMISELMNQGFDASAMMRAGMRLMIEQALEAEVGDALGRQRYERTQAPPKGYRNGYRRGRLKTAEGIVDFSVPQVTGTQEPFVSRIRQQLPERTEDPVLVASDGAPGLMRAIEDVFPASLRQR